MCVQPKTKSPISDSCAHSCLYMYLLLTAVAASQIPMGYDMNGQGGGVNSEGVCSSGSGLCYCFDTRQPLNINRCVHPGLVCYAIAVTHATGCVQAATPHRSGSRGKAARCHGQPRLVPTVRPASKLTFRGTAETGTSRVPTARSRAC
jgi:hypothetical protein